MHATLICFPGDSRNQIAKDYLREIPGITITVATSAKNTPADVLDETVPRVEIDSTHAVGIVAIRKMVDGQLQRLEEKAEIQRREKAERERRASQMRTGRYPVRTQTATA